MLGSGDSKIVENVIKNENENKNENESESESEKGIGIFKKIMEEVEFQEMKICDRVLCRPGAFQAEIKDGTYPLLRCPSEEGLIVRDFTPTVKMIRDKLSDILGINLNHAKIQLYKNKDSYINPLTDKCLDISQNDSIAIYRIGGVRNFTLTNKTDKTIKQSYSLLSNSLFILGPKTNAEWHHSTNTSMIEVDPCISIVFRNVLTFKRLDGHIFGKGALYGTEQLLDEALHTSDSKFNLSSSDLLNLKSKVHKSMITGYQLENKLTTYDAAQLYKDVIINTY